MRMHRGTPEKTGGYHRIFVRLPSIQLYILDWSLWKRDRSPWEKPAHVQAMCTRPFLSSKGLGTRLHKFKKFTASIQLFPSYELAVYANLIDGRGHKSCSTHGLTVKWMDELERIIRYGRKHSELKLAVFRYTHINI